MMSGGLLGSYQFHQLGTVSEPAVSPTASSQVLTMPFIASRCTESSAQPTPGNPSFTYIPSLQSKAVNQECSQIPSIPNQVTKAVTISTTPESETSALAMSNSKNSNNSDRHKLSAMSVKEEFNYSHGHSGASASADENQITPNHLHVSSNGRNFSACNQQGPVLDQSIGRGQSSAISVDVEERSSENIRGAESQQLASSRRDVIPDHEFASNRTSGPILVDQTPQQDEHRFSHMHDDQATESLKSSSESGRIAGYTEHKTQSNICDVLPTYNPSLMSSDHYNFLTGAELLPLQASSSDLSGVSGQTRAHEDSGVLTDHGNLYTDHNLVNRGYSTQTMKDNWTNWTSTNNSLLRNNTHNSLQGMPLSGAPISYLPPDSSLQESGSGFSDRSQGRDGTSHGTTYFSSPLMETEAQSEAMQLGLNQGYGGPGAESTTESGSGMMGVEHMNVHMHGQHMNITLPSAALAQSTLVQRSHLQASLNLWRNGGNELMFLPGSDLSMRTQAFPPPQAQPEINYGDRNSSPLSSVHPNSFLQNGEGHSTTLSLSSQQPSAIRLNSTHERLSESEVDGISAISQVDVQAKGKHLQWTENDNKYNGILSRFRTQDDLGASGFTSHWAYSPVLKNAPPRPPLASAPPNFMYHAGMTANATQDLLSEICSLRTPVRRARHNDQPRMNHNYDERYAGVSCTPQSFSDRDTQFHVNGAESSARRDYADNATSFSGYSTVEGRTRGPLHVHMVDTGVHYQREEFNVEKTLKDHLVEVLDELDHSYKWYSGFMTSLIDGFNTIAGPSAAHPYTALALQAMSRHYRCIRDAVVGQLRSVKRAMGEVDTAPGYASSRGETSRLKYVDQQLRQQRALQQLGMLQQHAWRPQRGLPERAVSVLRSWLFEHFLHPYPKDSDKIYLAKQTGLTRGQVSNWFINARVRLWKPMVEEMYQDEFSDAGDGSTEGHPVREKDNIMNYEAGNGSGHSDLAGQDEKRGTEEIIPVATVYNGQERRMESQRMSITPVCGGDGSFSHPNYGLGTHLTHSKSPITDHMVDLDPERSARGQSFGLHKRPRHVHDIHTAALVTTASPIVSMVVENPNNSTNFQTPPGLRYDNNYSSDTGHEDYSIPTLKDGSTHQDILGLASNGIGFGAYGGGNMRYPTHDPGSFVSRASGHVSSNGGVSLTLGLRHSDGISMSGASSQQIYSKGQTADGRRSKEALENSVRSMEDIHGDLPDSRLDSNPHPDGLKQRSECPMV